MVRLLVQLIQNNTDLNNDNIRLSVDIKQVKILTFLKTMNDDMIPY